MRGTILVVDDDPAVLEYAAEVLEEYGYAVLKAAEGANALVLLRGNQQIDLLFTDLVMPGNRRHRAGAPSSERYTRPQGAVYVGLFDTSASQGSSAQKALRTPTARWCDCGFAGHAIGRSRPGYTVIASRAATSRRDRSARTARRRRRQGSLKTGLFGRLGGHHARSGRRNRRRPPTRRNRARSARHAGPCEGIQRTRMFLNCHGSSRSRSSAKSLSRPARGVQSPYTPTISPR